MPREIFLVPMQGDGARSNPYRGKYTNTVGVTTSGTLRYARQAAHGLIMLEADQTILDDVASNLDVTRLATDANIDDVMPVAEIAFLRVELENGFVSQNVVKDAATRRAIIRAIIGVHFFSQRYEGIHKKSLPAAAAAAGRGLDHNPNSFPLPFQTELEVVAGSFGWNPEDTNNKSLRSIQESAAVNIGTQQLFIAGFQI